MRAPARRGRLRSFTREGWELAGEFGRVQRRRDGRAGWEIDLGRHVRPRYLYSARGVRLQTRTIADSVLAAIRTQIAKGVNPQAAVDEFAPVSSEPNRIGRHIAAYLAEQEDRASRLEISPNHLRELKRCSREEGAFSWWSHASIHEIDAKSLADWRRWLARDRDLSPKSVRNILGYFRAFLTWLYRLDQIDRVPAVPVVPIVDHTPTILSGTSQMAILQAIPVERRGAFLAACHGARPGEIRALDVSDVEEREGIPGLRIHRAMKGPNSTAPIGGTKTGEAAWIPIDEELCEWIQWRLDKRAAAAFIENIPFE